MFKLYYAPGTCALASHIALEEADASYAAERLDFKNSQQTTPQYLAINPKGRVPALVTDRGTLTETPAILAYIAHSFPQAKLIPDDAFSGLAALGSAVRSRSSTRVVGITGSTGKTSTKDILAAMCRPHTKTVAAEGGHNNEIGLPLTLTRIDEQFMFYPTRAQMDPGSIWLRNIMLGIGREMERGKKAA